MCGADGKTVVFNLKARTSRNGYGCTASVAASSQSLHGSFLNACAPVSICLLHTCAATRVEGEALACVSSVEVYVVGTALPSAAWAVQRTVADAAQVEGV